MQQDDQDLQALWQSIEPEQTETVPDIKALISKDQRRNRYLLAFDLICNAVVFVGVFVLVVRDFPPLILAWMVAMLLFGLWMAYDFHRIRATRFEAVHHTTEEHHQYLIKRAKNQIKIGWRFSYATALVIFSLLVVVGIEELILGNTVFRSQEHLLRSALWLVLWGGLMLGYGLLKVKRWRVQLANVQALAAPAP